MDHANDTRRTRDRDGGDATTQVLSRLADVADVAAEPAAPTPMPVGSGTIVVGDAADPAEAAADRVADSALRRLAQAGDVEGGGDADVHQHGPGCDHLRRSAAVPVGEAVVGAEGGALDSGTSAQIESRRGGGRQLDAPVLQRMQTAFGADLSSVRIHDDAGSARLNRMVSARAFTTGNDVFFGSGEYRPGTPDGDRVLAHEIAHTLQPGGTAKRLRRFSDTERDGQLQAVYAKRAEEYEFKLGYALSKHPMALEGAKALTDAFKALLLERHGAGKEGDAYNPSRTNQGKVTKARASEVFDQGNLRERMGVIYAAITNFDDKNFRMGALLEGAAKDDSKSGLVDTALVKGEGKTFGRRGKTADPKQNDRVDKTDTEMNKDMGAYFSGEKAPTPNRVAARGEAPLTSREYEAAFPAETKKIASRKGWSGLGEDAQVAAYAEVLGDKVLTGWKGGGDFLKPGAKLTEEGTNKNMRMLAGFSGTTDMYLHAGEYFKLDKKTKEKIRLAALGTMIPARDHSFHEIMMASKEYGLDYLEQKTAPGLGYSKFAPFEAKDLLAITGVKVFPHELINAGAKSTFGTESTAEKEAERVPVLPKKADLPKVGWKAKIQTGLSSYEAILKELDKYHAALTGKKDTRYAIADKVAALCDVWFSKNSMRKDDSDDGKRAALGDLRELALRAGTNWAAYATEQTITARKVRADLTRDADDNDPTDGGGQFAGSPGMVQGLGDEGVVALGALLEKCRALYDLPVSTNQGGLPTVDRSPEYRKLLASPEAKTLRAAIGSNADLMLRIFVSGFGATKVCQGLAADSADVVGYGQLVTAIDLVGSNYAGVTIRLDGVGPREGDKHKVDGGDAKKRNAALAAAYKLTPLELDCVIGYTTLEYKKFVDESASPERLAALDSALGKLPRYAGATFRGDYSYQHDPGWYRPGKKQKKGFTSTGKSLADSFIPKRPTAHVFISNKSGGDIEALSKKTWEQEVLFPRGVTFEVVAVVDKSKKVTGGKGKSKTYEARDATLDTTSGQLTGKHGMPTMQEQQGKGLTGVDLSIADTQVSDPKWTEHYTEAFSDKVWIFWKEV